MKSLVLLLALSFAVGIPSFGAGSGETEESAGWAGLRDGAAAFDSGDVQKAIELFSAAAQSGDREVAATGYYNHGTALALAAERSEDPEAVRPMLESAYQSLKRAYALGGLADQDQKNAQRNMQIVRERLAQQNEESQQNSDQNSESEEEQDGEEQNKNDESQPGAESDTEQEQQTGAEEEGEQMEEQRVNDILDQEAENQENREILELKGGIVDVDRDW